MLRERDKKLELLLGLGLGLGIGLGLGLELALKFFAIKLDLGRTGSGLEEELLVVSGGDVSVSWVIAEKLRVASRRRNAGCVRVSVEG